MEESYQSVSGDNLPKFQLFKTL